jgi:2,4-dienoyl-CoA reductase-like NADH-dependent reductase (Old Yellow Enzyme family)
MTALFDPFVLKGVTLKNRIAVSPMCQYSAIDGVVNDWHYAHLAGLARGGSALVIVEATGVSDEGRITPGCVGLWNDRQSEALRKAVELIRAAGAVPGIQIAHAGRKASANRPWEGDDHIPEEDPRAWQPIAPSAIAYGGGLARVPREMALEDIVRVTGEFVAAAERARDIGFEWLELHFAHGYLGQNFLSPHSNHRSDLYGGSLSNRSRFLNEILSAVRAVWPDHLPLTARMGVIEYDDREETLEESVAVIREFKLRGLDLIDVSLGFSTPDAEIPFGPNFMASIASHIRREADIPTATSWYISEPDEANALVRDHQVDLVMLARALLENHHWPYAAARALGVSRPAWTLPPAYAHWLERYRSATPGFR